MTATRTTAIPLFQLPYTQVVEAYFLAVATENAKFDAGLLDGEILARGPQRLFAFDFRDNFISFVFDQQGVPFSLLESFAGRRQGLALRTAIAFVVVLGDVPHPRRDHHRVEVPMLRDLAG